MFHPYDYRGSNEWILCRVLSKKQQGEKTEIEEWAVPKATKSADGRLPQQHTNVSW